MIVMRDGRIVLVTRNEERASKLYATLRLGGEKTSLTEALMDLVDYEGWTERAPA